MPDLNVVAVLTAKPGSQDALRAALESLLEPTRAEEGCLHYELFTSLADPLSFVTIERWRGQADLDAHMASDHIARALGVAADLFAASPATHPLAPVAS
ncbi:MAG: antibiotic biosynthesis monooxygenase [Burkholderiaceae bacterium]|nr:antibiotic biosynthesis monooxygenase [Microbacteriaceae bacterium]